MSLKTKLLRGFITPKNNDDASKSSQTEPPTQMSSDDSIKKDELEDGSPSGRKSLVTWDGEDDPENPKNWKPMRKWKAIFAMSSFVFMSPLSSTIVAPALPAIASDLGIAQPAVEQMVLSIFLLGFACGPLVASPLSEIYGRVRVVQTWNFMYIVFNAACGGARTKEAIIILRFIAGLCGSATLGIGGGTLSDLFRAKDRGKAVAIYSWSPILAPLVGAIIGGFIEQNLKWQWTFYISSLLSVAIQISGLFFLEETYPPLLLRRKKAKQIQDTGASNLYTEFDYLDEGRVKVLSANLVRPFKLLATQPIIQVLALYNAYLYGNIYMLYADFIDLWTDVYGESIQIAGLNYISIAIGSAIAAECCTLINDRIYRKLSKRNQGKGLPEFRIPIMIPATLFLSAGMFWYGWTAELKMHWIMPNIGTSIFVAGALACTISVNAYVIDTYGRYAASGLAAVSTIRCLAGFTFPMFAPYMYSSLGYGWSGSLLGFIGLGIGLPAAIMLGLYGKSLRSKSPYASKTH
ncbi:polyamine transporter 3 [Penicillium angulare]|uniref:polyamine transporter 3 n=1 Tax=Penicillium angulare TaxID=116970 RepID=UPI0025403A53|nr:polyamine transporter 3 [Penicillium angulare]KAJ5266746.1 polyamine transporter 3 [Penicillium angulare]